MWPSKLLTPHPTTTEHYQQQGFWPDTAAALFSHLPWPQEWQTAHWRLPTAAGTQLDELFPCSQNLQWSISPFPKAHFPMLGSRSGIWCPFFEFQTKSKDLSNYLWLPQFSRYCYVEPTPNNPTIKAALVMPNIPIGIELDFRLGLRFTYDFIQSIHKKCVFIPIFKGAGNYRILIPLWLLMSS